MLEKAKNRVKDLGLNVRFDIMNAQNLNFTDSEFDYVVATFVLCSVPDPVRTVKEMERVLKPGGRLCMVSISKEGHENSFFLGFYKCLHKIIPKFFNCRPIYLEDSVREAGYKIVKTEEFILAGLMPERIVVAEPEKGGLR